MHPAMAFFILMAFLALGEFVSVKTRAIVPSILIFLILLLSGVWSGVLPKEIIDLGGFSEAMTEVIMVVIVVNMGSSLSLDFFKERMENCFNRSWSNSRYSRCYPSNRKYNI
ncbi:hypothetical protein HMPREF1767_01755 [Fusobacterium nucleatum CTI-6]|uniref:Uncharacterized protein n=1 Tax=Fusobacterium nucleatum CTI-6 TaxID=1316587 RepID=U7TR96_FUSNU|nr:hypothetical protein HMPREF1767_01755 [Fusobacterium nucleatum CTI-6]